MIRDKANTYKHIWRQLVNSKLTEIYYNLLLEKMQRREKALNIFLVVVTSTSVSAWAIWKTPYLQWVWASVVALSQIVTLIKPYLNYAKYARELNEKYFFLQGVNTEYERLWLDYRFETITDEKAFKRCFELKEKLTKGLKFSDDILLTENEATRAEATERLKRHLNANFNQNDPL